jgi:outer membrane protein assembly factor BamB
MQRRHRLRNALGPGATTVVALVAALTMAACGVNRGVELPPRTYPITTSGDTIWLNRDGVLAALDTRDGSVDEFDDFSIGTGVEGVVRDGELWVSDWFTDVIRRFDLDRRTALEPIAAPGPLVMADAGDHVWFTSIGGTLYRTDDALRAEPVGFDRPACDVVVDGDRIWVVSAEAQSVSVLSAESGDVLSTVDVDRPVCALARAGSAMFGVSASGKQIVTFDRTDGSVVRTQPLRPDPDAERGLPATADTLVGDGDVLWSRAPQGIFVFDPSKGAVTTTVLASQPYAPVVLDNGRVWLFVERFARAIR